MNKGMTKLVAGTLIVTSIGGVSYYLGNSTQLPTYVKTEIVQTHDTAIHID